MASPSQKASISRVRWTTEEVVQLKSLFEIHGGDWVKIATKLKTGRTAGACYTKWYSLQRESKQGASRGTVNSSPRAPAVKSSPRKSPQKRYSEVNESEDDEDEEDEETVMSPIKKRLHALSSSGKAVAVGVARHVPIAEEEDSGDDVEDVALILQATARIVHRRRRVKEEK